MFTRILYPLMLVFLLTSCAVGPTIPKPIPVGEVIELSTYTTIQVVGEVINSQKSVGFILRNSENVDEILIVRPIGSYGVALYAVDMAKVSYRNVAAMIGKQTAYLANCFEATCLVAYLETIGWEKVSAKAIEGGRLVSALYTAYTSLPTFAFIWTDGLYLGDIEQYINPTTQE